MKKIFAFLLTLTLIFTNGIAVLAEEVEVPPADQISPNPNYASYTWIAPINISGAVGTNLVGQDGLSITMVQCAITKSGSSAIIATATTETNIIAEDIGGTVCVQRWKNNKWTNYYSFLFGEWDTDSAYISQTVSVESGYYYRVHVFHMANTLYSTVSASSNSSSIFIN